jgi:SAM-dependent methyltransferase
MSQPSDDPNRGDSEAYDRYLRGMDASMRQKVALTAAHLLCEGEVADMGMGSGSGSFALAALYPSLSVIGVDLDPKMVARARERHRLPNLRFVEGDIAAQCFGPGELEAILDSSVLHHVTSYGGYDRQAAARALAVQAAELADHGVLVLRDFVDPGPERVWLDLCTDDASAEADTDDPLTCSTARLFERFAREFRSLEPDAADRGFDYRVVTVDGDPPLAPGMRRYEVAFTHAAEFVLRKDYRADWAMELREEYTYATQQELEATFAELGLRVLASTPIRNPWIVKNRFRGQFRLHDTSGQELDFPPTNYVIVGQKVPAGEGVRFAVKGRAEPRGYLELSHYRSTEDDRIYDLVRRPGATIDVVPWFRTTTGVQVLARRSYPRPLLACTEGVAAPLGGTARAHYLTEPLNVQQKDKPLGQTVEELLGEFPNIGADGIRQFEPGTEYYPSPGGLQEQVRSVFVEIEPVTVQARLRVASGWSTSGLLRALAAHQVLRAAQVGGLPEARLELNVYDLLLRLGEDPGAWIGESIDLADAPAPPKVTTMAALARRPARRLFRRVDAAASNRFLELGSRRFAELDADGAELGEQPLELVLPRPLSTNTIAMAALMRCDGEVLIGVDDDDLPAAQCFGGNSQLLVAPAWRLPHGVSGIERSRRWTLAKLGESYGLRTGAVWELGGPYLPSPGVTPEMVFPLAVEVLDYRGAALELRWVRLSDAVESRAALQDGHLRIVALRAAHALGLLS